MLTSKDLYKRHDQLVQLKRKTYNEIYRQCTHKIKFAADMGEMITYFEIPHFMFCTGYAIVNIDACANYIINKFDTELPAVRATFHKPNILLLDWRR